MKKGATLGYLEQMPVYLDILLLDEPSNHLGLDTMEWLESYLKDYNDIVIIVSHDRYFINNIANRVVELSNGSFTSYEGNYEKLDVLYIEKLEVEKNLERLIEEYFSNN